MRRVIAATLLACALPAAAGGAQAAPDPTWQALAAQSLASLDGGAPAPPPALGRPLLLHFWASWCAPCRRELPALDAQLGRWLDAGLQLRAVSIDREPEKARRFAAELALAMPLLNDGPAGLAKRLDLPALPCSYLFDGEGRLVVSVLGDDERGLARLETALADLLEPDPPAAAALGTH